MYRTPESLQLFRVISINAQIAEIQGMRGIKLMAVFREFLTRNYSSFPTFN